MNDMGRATKRNKQRFVGIPYSVVTSNQYCQLSAQAVKLLVDLSFQRTGSNNGKLSPCWTLMRQRGWKSSDTLYKAFNELLGAGFVVVTKRGKKLRGHPTLVAVTWDGIDDCGINFDEGIRANPSPLGYWCKHPDCWQSPPNLQIVTG